MLLPPGGDGGGRCSEEAAEPEVDSDAARGVGVEAICKPKGVDAGSDFLYQNLLSTRQAFTLLLSIRKHGVVSYSSIWVISICLHAGVISILH